MANGTRNPQELPPPILEDAYNQHVRGVYGEFGTGANAQIFFLQTGISPQELKKIALISDIPGSECWDVRDLFQREVDEKRVRNSLLPYFQDPHKVKFFNPLTLTLLPVDPQNPTQILRAMPLIQRREVTEGDYRWVTMEMDGFFRFKHLKNHHEYGRFEWNDTKVRIAAIDGQHRLSALKRYHADVIDNTLQHEFMFWTIPVVICGLRVLNPERQSGSLLDVIRSIFIYINTTARVPSEARQILLTDESINNMCTQELLQYSHDNDILSLEERDPDRMPLLFYDWRGEEEGGRPIPSPAAIKSIVEVNSWFEEYICGSDFSPSQESALGILPNNQDLHQVFVTRKLDPSAISGIRKEIRTSILPGMAYLLEHFTPYNGYIKTLRDLEHTYHSKSDVSRHAFYHLRFGSNRAGQELQDQITKERNNIVDRLLDIKDSVHFPVLLDLDIGMRAVMYAFGSMRADYNKIIEHTAPWLEYSTWFTRVLNRVYEDGWFSYTGKLQRELLRHITIDHNDSVCNYRIDKIDSGFGCLMIVLLAAYGIADGEVMERADFEEIWEEHSDTLLSTLTKGYRREVKTILRDQFDNNPAGLNKAVAAEASKRTESHLQKLRNTCEGIWDV